MTIRRVAKYVYRSGLVPALHTGFYRGINQVAVFGVLRGMTLEIGDISDRFLNAPIRYDCGFLDEATLHRFAEDDQNALSHEFIEWAVRRGDRCYALTDGGRLAAYGWYSMQSTEIRPKLVLHFDPRYVCIYKGFTHPRYRGQRLHAVGMAKAAQAFTHQGKKGLISYVESHDYRSFHSCDRLGFKVFGSIWIVGHHGRYLTGRTRRCHHFSFGVAHA